jgi:hypothetical protein
MFFHRLLAIHLYTQLIIHIKNASLLDSCPFPLKQIPCIHNIKGNNFYVLSYMWSTIILVKLHTHLQIISIKKQEIIFCMHTQVHTHTHTNIQTHLTYIAWMFYKLLHQNDYNRIIYVHIDFHVFMFQWMVLLFSQLVFSSFALKPNNLNPHHYPIV